MGSIQPLVLGSGCVEDIASLEILSEKTVFQQSPPYESFNEKTEVYSRPNTKLEPSTTRFEPNETKPEPNKRVNTENGLVSSAMPLIHYSMSLLTLNNSVDIDVIRTRLISDIGRFENKAGQCFSDHSQVIAARYLLCSFIDEVVSTSPWGQSHKWSQESLLSYFHNETYGGEGFFKLLERAQQQPETYVDLLELMYVCLSLGFAGRYRVDSKGATKLEGVRESMMTTIDKYRAPDNHGLVVGDIITPVHKVRAYKIQLLQWLALSAVIILILINSVAYLLASHNIDSQMDRVFNTYFQKVDHVESANLD